MPYRFGFTRSGKRYRSYSNVSGAVLARRRVVRRNNNQRFTFARQMVPISTRRAVRSGIGVTDNYDRKQVYRKRRMPRYRRRIWKRFINRVHAVSEKDLGSRTVVFNTSVSFSNNVSGNQVVAHAYLYPMQGNVSFAQDIFLLTGMENEANPTAVLGETVSESTKWLFQSAVLDITIRNASFLTTDTGPVLDNVAKMEVDVYEISVKVQTGDSSSNYNNVLALLNDNASVTKPLENVGPEIDINLRGVTPFDHTYTLSRWGMKIWKKTKYVLNNGDCITYQVRDPKRRIITQREAQRFSGFNRPGWTRILLIIGKLVPGISVGSTSGTYTENMNIGYTRKYLYKIEGMNDDRTRYSVN